jgi:WD40 repeat protein
VARKQIRTFFPQQYAQAAKDPAAARSLADRLLRESRDTEDDDLLRYAGFREAAALAARAGDLPLAVQAVRDLAALYDVDAAALKLEALRAAAQQSMTEKGQTALVEAALELLREELEDDNFDGADALGQLALEVAKKTKDATLAASVEIRLQQAKVLRQQFEQVLPALAVLKKDPKDPAANLAVGRFLCLVRGNWKRGLPLLALGSDATLRDLALSDLKNPVSEAAQMAVGDGWWDLGEKEKGPAKKHLQLRAVFWYLQVVPRVSGINKTRLERRIQALGIIPSVLPPPPVVGLVRTFVGHKLAVQSAALSPDGRYVVSGGNDRDLRLWDTLSGKRLNVLKGHSEAVWCVTFSPDGRYLLSCGDDRTIRLWEVATLNEVRRFPGHKAEVNRVAFSPDGTQALSGDADGGVRLWDVATGKELRQLTGHKRDVWGIAFTPDGRRALTGSGDRTLRLWDVDSGKQLRLFEGHTENVTAAAVSPDGRRGASGSIDRSIRLWDLETGKELRQLTGHNGTVLAVVFSPDGRRLLSCSADRTVRLWDAETGKQLHQFDGHTNDVTWVVFSADGRYALSSSIDDTVRLWGLPK